MNLPGAWRPAQDPNGGGKPAMMLVAALPPGVVRVVGVFSTLQGEGHHAGRAAVFVRLWECHRRCVFCDTDFMLGAMNLPGPALLARIAHEAGVDCRLTPMRASYPIALAPGGGRLVVFTGGEPLLQQAALMPVVDTLAGTDGWRVAFETTGDIPLVPPLLDLVRRGAVHITVSPKCANPAALQIQEFTEFKLLMDTGTMDADIVRWEPVAFPGPVPPRVQPIDAGDPDRTAANIAAAVAFVQRHPEWRLSFQIHKAIGLP